MKKKPQPPPQKKKKPDNSWTHASTNLLGFPITPAGTIINARIINTVTDHVFRQTDVTRSIKHVVGIVGFYSLGQIGMTFGRR